MLRFEARYTLTEALRPTTIVSRMGAWSDEPFGNDTAADWALELEHADSWQVVVDILTEYVASGAQDEDLEQVVVGACEVVARALGRPTQHDVYTEPARLFVDRVGEPPAELIELGRRALDHVSADSALLAAWLDSGDAGDWIDSVASIRQALHG